MIKLVPLKVKRLREKIWSPACFLLPLPNEFIAFLNFVSYHNRCIGKIKSPKERKWVTFCCTAVVFYYPFSVSVSCKQHDVFVGVSCYFYLILFFSFLFLTRFFSLVTFVAGEEGVQPKQVTLRRRRHKFKTSLSTS